MKRNDDDLKNNPTLRGLVVLVVVLMAALALLMILSGCSSSGGQQAAKAAPATAAATTPAVVSAPSPAQAAQGVYGQTMFSQSIAGPLAVTVNTPSTGPKDPSVPGDVVCVTFPVAVSNNGTAALGYPGDWKVRGQDGQSYNFTTGCNITQPLTLGAVPALTTAAGVVGFDAPAHGTLTYRPPGATVPTIEWAY